MRSFVAPQLASLIARADTQVLADQSGLRQETRPTSARTTGIGSRFLGGDQFALFVLAAVGMFVLTPRLLLRGYTIFAGLVGGDVAGINWQNWASVPLLLPIGVTLSLITFRQARVVRLTALIAAVVILGLSGPLAAGGLLPLAVFTVAVYAMIRLPFERIVVALMVSVFTVSSMAALLRWWPDTPAVVILGGLPIVVPLLWYSVYEHRKEAALSFRRFVLFVGGRMFDDSPVMTYRDLFAPAEGTQLTATRWAGVRAIYIALVASITGHLISQINVSSTTATITGIPLIFLSYLEYIGYCCGIVVRFNVFIGVLRLFGIPLRSNFRYWLLARTPNEHWQRWNLLAREWFLTFLFYPIMRARRWLFAAVMAALLGAGFLHILPLMMIGGFSATEFTARSIYWVMNGLAIYLVIKLPALYPGMPARLGMPNSRVWSVVGIVLTSAFYAILHGLRNASASWGQMGDYLSRIVGLAG